MIYIFFTNCISPQPLSGLWPWGRYWCIGLIQGVIWGKKPIIIYFLISILNFRPSVLSVLWFVVGFSCPWWQDLVCAC